MSSLRADPVRPWLTAAVAALALLVALVSGCASGNGSTEFDRQTTSPAPAPPDAETAPAVDCDLYASPTGSDESGDGSLRKPWASVDRLVSRLHDADGQRVGCLRGGEYTATGIDPAGGEPQLRIDHPGITLTSYPGERARVIGRIYISDTGDDVTVSDLDLAGRASSYFGTTCTGDCGNASFPIAGTGVTVSGNDITNDRTSICIQLINNGYGQGDDATITGNRLHDCGEFEPKRSNTAHAIYVNHASGARISRNVITQNGAFGVKLGPQAVGATVEHNVMDGNAVGVLVGDQPPCPSTTEASNGNTIAGNVITRSEVRGNIEGFWSTSADSSGCFDVGDDTRGNLVSGNCLYADNADPFYDENGGLMGRTDEIPESGGFADDGTNLTSIPSGQDPMPPIYADPANSNFHLQSVSGSNNDCLELSGVDDGAAAANVRPTAAAGLSEGGADRDPAVAVGPDGRAVAAWVSGAGIEALVREPGAQLGPDRWDATNPVDTRPQPKTLAAGDGLTASAVAAGGSGDGAADIAVWRASSGSGVEVRAAIGRDGRWGRAVSLSDPGRSIGEPQVAAAPDGSAVVAWSADGAVIARTLPAGATRFGEPQTFDEAGGDPRVAAADGAALVIWQSGGKEIRTASWDGTSWSSPVTLPSDGAADEPAIAASADGALAAWRVAGIGIVAATADLPATSWGASAPLAPGVVSGPPSAAIGPGGPLVAWRGGEGDDAVIELAVSDGAGGLAPAQSLTAAAPESSPTIVAASDSEALVTWADGSLVRGSYQPANRPWSSPVTLNGPGTTVDGEPAAAIGPSGAAAVLWADSGSIRTAGFYP